MTYLRAAVIAALLVQVNLPLLQSSAGNDVRLSSYFCNIDGRQPPDHALSLVAEILDLAEQNESSDTESERHCPDCYLSLVSIALPGFDASIPEQFAQAGHLFPGAVSIAANTIRGPPLGGRAPPLV